LLTSFQSSSKDNDARSGLRQAQRHGPAQNAAAAGDDGGLTLQAE
jgi:hypothetical protein